MLFAIGPLLSWSGTAQARLKSWDVLHQSRPNAPTRPRQGKRSHDNGNHDDACPFSYKGYLTRAAYYGMNNRISKAIMNCTEAINIEPKSIRAYLYR